MVKAMIHPFTPFPTHPHVGDSKVSYKLCIMLSLLSSPLSTS